jgi:hypothetical protein
MTGGDTAPTWLVRACDWIVSHQASALYVESTNDRKRRNSRSSVLGLASNLLSRQVLARLGSAKRRARQENWLEATTRSQRKKDLQITLEVD